MATYTVTIPFKSGAVKVDCTGVSLCDFHLLSKNIEDFIATRVSDSSALGPMRPLEPEERSPISMTSWHTPTLGELEAPFEEEPVIDLCKACGPDDEEYTPVITDKPEKSKSAWQYFLCHSKLGFKEAGEKWRNIEPYLKEHYNQIAKSDKHRYAEEMKAYNDYKCKASPTDVETETTPESTDKSEKAEKKKRAQIRKEYKKARGIKCPFACFGCKKEYMSKNKFYENHTKTCKFAPSPPCYDGSDGVKSYHDLNCTIRAYP
jgi:hypothetical protein